MDENNVNPTPVDSLNGENENSEPEVNESEAVAAEVESEPESPETSEYDQLVADYEAVLNNEVAEPANDEETAETENEETPEENAEPKKKKKKSKGAVVAIVLLVALLVFAGASLIAAIVKSNASKIDLDQVVVSVNDVDSSAAEFYQIYMYYYGYNSYYQYSEEELKELAIKQLVFTNALYSEAVEAGYELNEEDQAMIDEQLASITDTAESASMSADEYLDMNYCEGFTLEMFKEIVEKSQLAQRFYADKIEAVEEQYKGSEGQAKIEAEYTANKLDYDLADVSYWYFDASEETAKTDAEAIVAQVNEGKSFADAIKSVTGDSEAIPNNLKGYSKTELTEGNFAEAGVEWIFEVNEDGSYKNGTGSATTIDDESVVYVLYVNNAPQRDETLAATTYYIQVDVSTDASIKTENELNLEAKSAADTVLKKFEQTDKSAESFTALMSEYNEGDNDLISADVFAEMKNDGSVDAVVEDWAFDEARKAGDYTLVEGDGCYYVLFFASKEEYPVWFQTAMDTILANDIGNFETTVLEEYESKTVTNDEVVNEVIAYVSNMASAQYGY